VAALFLNRGTLGIHANGRSAGRDFEKLRDIFPANVVTRTYIWKARPTAARPQTKIYQSSANKDLCSISMPRV